MVDMAPPWSKRAAKFGLELQMLNAEWMCGLIGDSEYRTKVETARAKLLEVFR